MHKAARLCRIAAALSLLSVTGACSAPSLVVRKPDGDDINRALTQLWARDLRRTARSGDWLLTRSYSMTGDLISLARHGAASSFSHASIYDAGRGTVIEAIDPVVREVPLSQLLDRNHYVVVVRPAYASDAEAHAAVARARSVVGADFDFWGMFGAGKPEAFYCSELVVWATRLPILDGAVITPAQLVAYGAVVYDSGTRDDPAVQAAAITSRARLRTAAASTSWVRP
jgi:uncharacterized protein YycO